MEIRFPSAEIGQVVNAPQSLAGPGVPIENDFGSRNSLRLELEAHLKPQLALVERLIISVNSNKCYYFQAFSRYVGLAYSFCSLIPTGQVIIFITQLTNNKIVIVTTETI
jgi:hypothetical protein